MCDDEMKLDPSCELFRKGDPEGQTYSILNKYVLHVGCVAISVGTILLGNSVARRPLWAGEL